MGIFQRLNKERGITVLLITHEMDIAEYGTRLIRFRDGRVVADQAVLHRRNAADELAALPPPEPDQIRRRPKSRPAAGRRRTERFSEDEERHMSLFMTIRIAFKALGRNKLRTALTMLGMIIGVAAVIAMVALGSGAQAHDRRADQVGRHEPDHDLRRAASAAGGAHGRRRHEHAPDRRRRQGAARSAARSPYVAESVNTRTQLIYGNRTGSTNIEGTNVDLPPIRSWPMMYGAFFTRRGRQGRSQGHRARRQRRPTTSSAKASIRPTRSSASATTSSRCSA